MKIAIPLFGNRISPRFDFSPEIWIIEVESGQVVRQERLPVAALELSQRLDQLALKGVSQLICGGIDMFCSSQLTGKGIDILHNVAGEAEIAVHLFLKGRLRPGFCCEGRGRKRSCGWKKAPPWKEEIDD